MKHQEKKYQVKSFDKIKQTLEKLKLVGTKEKTTNHYYGRHDGNNVTKLVSYSDKNSIHILEESEGKFSLKDSIPVENIESGLNWLKNKGYKIVDLVKMANIDFEYKEGLIRLYLIDDWLYSVILDYPEGRHDDIERELGLTNDMLIILPYNKHLEKIGKLRSMKLNYLVETLDNSIILQ